MIDIKLIRQNPDAVKEGMRAKGVPVTIVDEVLKLDVELISKRQFEEELRAKLNINTPVTEEIRNSMVEVKQKLKSAKEAREECETRFGELLHQIPNLPFDSVPFGLNESDNVEVRKHGEIRNFSFTPKNHLELGSELGIVNFDDGAKVSGSQFYYLDGDGALLEYALTQFGIKKLLDRGFTPSITPDLARSRFYLGTGYMPKGNEAQTYEIDGEDLGLIATAEVTLAGRHADKILSASDLPLKYAGVSHCFRREAGAHGKYSKGLYRVHQFTKLEMFVFAHPNESKAIHDDLLRIEEEIWQDLGIPYRVLEMCTGDLGAMAAKKYDIEAWMPGRAEYGEVTSTSNCTDYQARNLNIRFKDSDGKMAFVHMLNGTAIAISRALIAVIENYQNADGSITVPNALQQYMHGKQLIQAKTKCLEI